MNLYLLQVLFYTSLILVKTSKSHTPERTYSKSQEMEKCDFQPRSERLNVKVLVDARSDLL